MPDNPPTKKPIETMAELVQEISASMDTIKNDIAVIKDRLYKAEQRRKEMEEYEIVQQNKGWGAGWW
jgi:hypothetical protein